VRREIRAMNPGIPVRLETLEDRIRESLVTERVIAVISGFLGAVALLLASAGLYGLMAYTVSRRTNEIGIRMALGAPKGAVLGMVLRESVLLAAVGVALGLAGSIVLGRLVSNLLYGLTPTDPISLASSAAIMLAVAMAAASIPARRAAHVDPVVALRTE
jgi:ABC-type antimicrobial peptide transport system permease subunit